MEGHNALFRLTSINLTLKLLSGNYRTVEQCRRRANATYSSHLSGRHVIRLSARINTTSSLIYLQMRKAITFHTPHLCRIALYFFDMYYHNMLGNNKWSLGEKPGWNDVL